MPGLRRLTQSRREQKLDFSAIPIHSIVNDAQATEPSASQSPQCKQGNQPIESVSCDGEGKAQE